MLTPDKIEEVVRNSRNLKKGWDSYKAEPPNETSIQNALRFIELCKDFVPTKFCPTCMGGMAITWADEGELVFVEFYNKGTTWYIMHKDEYTDMIVKEVKDYQEAINEIKTFLNDELQGRSGF